MTYFSLSFSYRYLGSTLYYIIWCKNNSTFTYLHFLLFHYYLKPHEQLGTLKNRLINFELVFLFASFDTAIVIFCLIYLLNIPHSNQSPSFSS